MDDELRKLADQELANGLPDETEEDADDSANDDASGDDRHITPFEAIKQMTHEERANYWKEFFTDKDRIQRNLENAVKATDKYGHRVYLFGMYWVSLDRERLFEIARGNNDGIIIICRLYDGKFISRKCSSINVAHAKWTRALHDKWYGFIDPDYQQVFI